MLNTNLFRMSLVLALGVFTVACGDDDPVVETDGGTADTGESDTAVDTGMEDTGMEDTGMEDAGMEDTGMEDAGMEDTGMEDTGMEETGTEDTGMEDTGMEDTGMEDTGMEDAGTEGGECTNETDLATLASVDAAASAGSCGLGCLADEDPRACSIACIVDDTGLSNECAGCFGDIVACSIEFCLAPCASDPAGDACAACQVESGCVDAFDACTGDISGE
jgi:hypothetical protein